MIRPRREKNGENLRQTGPGSRDPGRGGLLRRLAALAAALFLAAGLPAGAGALTLYTASSFAGEDESAVTYAQLLETFEAEHGCVISDHSSASSESWKQSVLNDFAAGNEPDVLFFFARGADSAPILSRVIPIEQLNREYPELKLPVSEALREADGRVYAVPVRPFWEGLLVNRELFEEEGLALPDTWERLLEAVRVFRSRGIVPISVSLTEAPHYLAEMVIQACAPAEEQQARPGTPEEVPASWIQGMGLLRELYEVGAFPENAALIDDRTAGELFHSGKAAMRVDGVWFAHQMTEEEMNRTAVLPAPRRGETGGAVSYIGGVSMGFYLTRRAYEQPAVREEAVALLGWLTSEESRAKLSGGSLTGSLQKSAAELIGPDRLMLSPIQDAMNAAAREVWLMECVPAVAEGRMTPEECWRRVMQLHPFQP